MWTKRRRSLFMLLTFLFLANTVNAEGGLAISPSVLINGQKLQSKAILEKGSTMVPLRAIFEQFGAKVDYVGTSKTIFATKGSIRVTYKMGDVSAKKNDQNILLKTLPVVREGVTYIPLRLVAEAFDANLLWNGSAKTVIIRSPENNVHTPVAEILKAYGSDPMSAVNKAIGFPGQPRILFLSPDVKQQEITITNVSNTDQDLSGWNIKEFRKNGNFVFPKGFILPVGQNVRISIGKSKGDLTWNTQGIFREGAPNRVDLYKPTDKNMPVLQWEG